MARRGEIVIECDSEDCYAEIIFGVDALAATELHELLTEADWATKDGHDYCPDCCKDENPRARGDDDGVEYGHPGDRLRGIE